MIPLRYVLALVLAAIVPPSVLFAVFTGVRERQRADETRALVQALQRACDGYEIDWAAYPPMTYEGSRSLHYFLGSPRQNLIRGYNGRVWILEEPPYVQFRYEWLERGTEPPHYVRDLWRRRIGYANPGVRHPTGVDIWSLGPDGVPSYDDIYNSADR